MGNRLTTLALAVLLSSSASAHEGPPYPILVDEAVGPYVKRTLPSTASSSRPIAASTWLGSVRALVQAELEEAHSCGMRRRRDSASTCASGKPYAAFPEPVPTGFSAR